MPQYPNQIDCVWTASDRDGHVGAFIAAGAGPLPAAAFDSGRISVADIEEHLCRLPVISPWHLLVGVPRPDGYVALCERGLFVYDWTDVHRSLSAATRMYQPVAVPALPLHLDQLPADLHNIASALRLRTVCFDETAALDIRSLLTCVEAE
ncbi:hypothetical protein HL667_03420 [Bradyrhizobium sp. 83012]|uniref:Uncharacterized protein n=1 Tax=Bradyrhizobium aeschynomenes TaxID=2734909 RepID=A0ABX2C6Z8_9BRAD|nr:hypothetical protein [Bradyrhizobium aeschynomenes]NPU64041.1 hypothetical protein [Bradyrhizobium aeschynomenes]